MNWRAVPGKHAVAGSRANCGLCGSTNEPAAKLSLEGPLAGPLARGIVLVPFHTEYLKIVPVYGEAALGVTPRIGHLHVTVDHGSWHWVHANNEPIVLNGLSHGAHQLTVELADANHHRLDLKEVEFIIP